MELQIRNNHFLLLHQKAIYWRETNTLLIADLHIGKITHFRKQGIAVSDLAIAENFSRLDILISLYHPFRIIFLGDLFHNRLNSEWDLLAAWRSKHREIQMLIVPGNHDVLPLWLFSASDIEVTDDDYTEGPFVFTHHPKTSWAPHEFVFAGHIHPVFSLKAKARQTFRLPCFLYAEQQMILPSFGIFTGGYEISSMPHNNIFVIAEQRIFDTRQV